MTKSRVARENQENRVYVLLRRDRSTAELCSLMAIEYSELGRTLQRMRRTGNIVFDRSSRRWRRV